jgi:glycine cleavage system regulatory protein
MKCLFKKEKDLENPYDFTEVVVSVESDSLSDIVEGFVGFLKASGFSLEDLEVVTKRDCDYETKD